MEELRFPMLLTGRTGKQLTSGEDVEYCSKLRLMGYSTRVFPDLEYKHEMTASRMRMEYVEELCRVNAQTYPITFEYLALEQRRLGASGKKLMERLPFPVVCILGAARGVIVRILFALRAPAEIKRRKLLLHRIGSGRCFSAFY